MAGKYKNEAVCQVKITLLKAHKKRNCPGENPPLYVSHLRPLFLSFTSCDSQAFSLSCMQVGKEAICQARVILLKLASGLCERRGPSMVSLSK